MTIRNDICYFLTKKHDVIKKRIEPLTSFYTIAQKKAFTLDKSLSLLILI